MRLLIAIALTVAAATPAVAEDFEGTWKTKGTHSALGAFHGEVTITRTSVHGSYDLEGVTVFSGT